MVRLEEGTRPLPGGSPSVLGRPYAVLSRSEGNSMLKATIQTLSLMIVLLGFLRTENFMKGFMSVSPLWGFDDS